jgi:hypothetical protein
MLQMGSSKPWTDAMEVLSGQREMDASGLLEYFKPLEEWLEKNNRQFGEYIGWEPSQKRMYYLLTCKCSERDVDFWMHSHVFLLSRRRALSECCYEPYKVELVLIFHVTDAVLVLAWLLGQHTLPSSGH